LLTGAGDLEKALETMETMRLEGIEPDVITYTSLIKACSLVTTVDPYDHNNNNSSINNNDDDNNGSDDDDDDDDDDTMDANKNNADDNNSNHHHIRKKTKINRFKPQTYGFKPMLISGKNPIQLADDLFLEMQQRDNHFTYYIETNKLTYEMYY
jgi:pentatricopeptide repeat protein